ncbi:MAG: hypothetical protein H6837_19340 [Planctomycetes bacterium]|nr:hypothetical protein [Planctomycetota bacterium]
MSSVARSCKVVAGKENGRFCPEAGCLPVEEQVLTFDEASSDLARSQQLGHESFGLAGSGPGSSDEQAAEASWQRAAPRSPKTLGAAWPR